MRLAVADSRDAVSEVPGSSPCALAAAASGRPGTNVTFGPPQPARPMSPARTTMSAMEGVNVSVVVAVLADLKVLNRRTPQLFSPL